jgi:hypothetical protein
MKPAFHFRCRFANTGEIFSQPTTFLPVIPARSALAGQLCTFESFHFVDFMPDSDLNRKNLTVAQPLLKEVRNEMR